MTTTNEMNEDTSLIETLSRIDGGAMLRLHERLARSAESEGILDIAYRTVDSPVGQLLIAATSRGLVRVAYANEDHDRVLARLSKSISPRLLNAPRRLDPVAYELDQYFDGKREVFDLPLDFQLSSGFRREVLAHLPEIAYGKTASYAAIAELAGSPKAVRAVGTACATNPLPIVIPCHRVIRSDGSLGGYAGGPVAKETLLALEAAR